MINLASACLPVTVAFDVGVALITLEPSPNTTAPSKDELTLTLLPNTITLLDEIVLLLPITRVPVIPKPVVTVLLFPMMPDSVASTVPLLFPNT